jgi:hypothetical protein
MPLLARFKSSPLGDLISSLGRLIVISAPSLMRTSLPGTLAVRSQMKYLFLRGQLYVDNRSGLWSVQDGGADLESGYRGAKFIHPEGHRESQMPYELPVGGNNRPLRSWRSFELCRAAEESRSDGSAPKVRHVRQGHRDSG